MVGTLRAHAHLFHSEAYLPADVLAPVLGGYIHIARPVPGRRGGGAVLIEIEQIELLLRTEHESAARFLGPCYGVLEKLPGVAGEGRAVGVGDGGEHLHHPPVFGAPGQGGEGLRVRMEQQVAAGLPSESGDGGSVESYPVAESPGQLIGHDGYVLLLAENVAEGEADEFHILLPGVLDYLITGILHKSLRICQLATYICLYGFLLSGVTTVKGAERT